MAKTIGFIDGFNLYHAITHVNEKGNKPYAKYRWLNYRKLTECFVGDGDSLEEVFYFTAYVSWDSHAGREKKERHQRFVAVQRDRGVKVVMGRFRPVWKKCMAQCKQQYQTYEEKRTDVNIAVTMTKLAFLERYEKAILISGDSDLLPAMAAIKELKPSTKIVSVIPEWRKGAAISNAADIALHLKEGHLRKCVLPFEVTLKRGAVIQCPAKWL